MKTVALGATDLRVSRLSYGAMRISGTWDKNRKLDQATIEKGIGILETAVDAGYTFIDHADIYGHRGCETIQGFAMQKHPEWRDRLIIATKCGIRWPDEPFPGAPHRYDFDGNYIRQSVEGSLARLQVERIDLYQLHRPDWLADPADIAGAMIDLQRAGKVRYFGVSNFRPSQVSMLQSALPFPLVSNQVEIHLLRLAPFEDGTLDQCIEKKLTPLAWSPLAGGRLAAAIDGKAPLPPSDDESAAIIRLRPVLEQVAKAYGCSPWVILLAWLMRHPSGIIPIIGTTRPELLRDAALADDITLDRESWYTILLAARGEKLP